MRTVLPAVIFLLLFIGPIFAVEGKPNIVFIFADDQTFDTIGGSVIRSSRRRISTGLSNTA